MSDLIGDLLELLVEVIIDGGTHKRKSKKSFNTLNTGKKRGPYGRHNSSYSKEGRYAEPPHNNPWEKILKPGETANKTITPKTGEKDSYNNNLFDSQPLSGKPKKTYSDTSYDKDKYEIKKEEPYQKQEPQHHYNQLSSSNDSVKLELLLLAYMFTEDDGKISGKEKKAIKHHFKDNVQTLSEQDIREIKQHNNDDPSLQNIRAFINTRKLEDTVLTQAIRTIKEIGNDERYRSVINRIESSLLESMGY